VIPEKRIVIASVIVGIFGAFVVPIGVFCSGITDGDPIGWIPLGIVTGILACYSCPFYTAADK